jgi:peroxiredoxin Q/BCP
MTDSREHVPRSDHPAPAFAATTTDGTAVTDRDFLGRWLVLYFYPRDNTPGCTTEARDFQERLAAFEAAGATVVGVSNDDASSHRRFCEKQGLSFPLLVDSDRDVSRAYDVMRMKHMFGRRFEGIERSTFLIDPEGVIREIWRKVRVPGHVDAVLERLSRG